MSIDLIFETTLLQEKSDYKYNSPGGSEVAAPKGSFVLNLFNTSSIGDVNDIS